MDGCAVLVVEPIAGHVIEPLLYGHSTGLSPVAVVASATFWTWLWGPIGLVLATPLMVCLVVLGRHVDRLQFLDVMFGDRPALTPPEVAYQRMLAADPVEAAEEAEKFLNEKPLTQYYQDVLLEGLKLAARDARRGALDEDRTERVRDAVAEILDDLSDHVDVPPAQDTAAASALRGPDLGDNVAAVEPARPPEAWRTRTRVLCVPGASVIDEAATLILAQLIARKEIGVRSEGADALSISRIFAVDTKDIAIVCLCYLEEVSPAQLRLALRRLRRKAPDAFIVVARFDSYNPGGQESTVPPDTEFVATLSEAVRKVETLARGTPDKSPELSSAQAA
jgi:hypothetical protein